MPDPDGSAATSRASLERRLLGVSLPGLALQFVEDGFVSLATLARQSDLAIFFYRGVESASRKMEYEDDLRAIDWADHEHELLQFGYRVVGVSVQSPLAQVKLAAGEPLPYMLLSDPDLELAEHLGLPTTGDVWCRAYEPLTILVRDERVSRVLHPIDPARDASSAVEWVRRETRP